MVPGVVVQNDEALALQTTPATNGMEQPSGTTSYSVNTVKEIDKKLL